MESRPGSVGGAVDARLYSTTSIFASATLSAPVLDRAPCATLECCSVRTVGTAASSVLVACDSSLSCEVLLSSAAPSSVSSCVWGNWLVSRSGSGSPTSWKEGWSEGSELRARGGLRLRLATVAIEVRGAMGRGGGGRRAATRGGCQREERRERESERGREREKRIRVGKRREEKRR
eukprot:scaffold31501_cov32-Tisochrysis_lutea.AAC.2